MTSLFWLGLYRVAPFAGYFPTSICVLRQSM